MRPATAKLLNLIFRLTLPILNSQPHDILRPKNAKLAKTQKQGKQAEQIKFTEQQNFYASQGAQDGRGGRVDQVDLEI